MASTSTPTRLALVADTIARRLREFHDAPGWHILQAPGMREDRFWEPPIWEHAMER